jgi:hypothetical protein
VNSYNPTRIACQRCGMLTASTLALWVILAGPAYWLADSRGLEGLTISALLCWLPGCVVFFIVGLLGLGNNQAMPFLMGSGLRLFAVLVGALAINQWRADLGVREFLSWLIVFYLVTLVVETLLIVKSTDSVPMSSSVSPPSHTVPS